MDDPQVMLMIWEPRWLHRLSMVSLAAEAEISASECAQIAEELGALYREHKRVGSGVTECLRKWPACLVASMTGVAISSFAHGAFWPAFWEAAKYPGTGADEAIWGDAFKHSLERLGLPVFPNLPLRHVGQILMHAGIPAYCLDDFFRLLLERSRQDPGLDADSFLAWATETGRGLRLSELDKPAQRFLLSGGEYAHDIVDRTLDLLDRLAHPEPDFDAVQLPDYMVEKAKSALAVGSLDVSRGSRSVASARRQAQPRIALDPYGQGVHVVLPAVGETPDGIARWRITADGETATVQSRAAWVGAAETTPETVFPLARPVRSVAVSLSEREDLAAELAVYDAADPVLFFGDDGRRLSGAISLPRSQVWIMHPADRELEITGEIGHIAEPAVPFGWDGWRLRRLSLEGVRSIGLQRGNRSHSVELQARLSLRLGEPVRGASTPFGSPVYPVPPQLELPGTDGAEITWHVEIRRVAGATSLVSRVVKADDESDIWAGVPRPVLGAFEVTVRGPLGRGLRRTVFVAEGLSVTYSPPVRLLTEIGLASGKATLTAGIGAVVHPSTLPFGPDERIHSVEYRTADESEPIVITPPHAAVMCAGAGVTTWTTSVLHLVSEEFEDAGKLLVRIPGQDRSSRLEVAARVPGQPVQTIPASGQQSAGLVGFDLSRAADTVAKVGRAELAVGLDGQFMPIARVRPRRLATGVELVGNKLVLHNAAIVGGLTAGVYLAYAPWRPPAELEVAPDGMVALPDELCDAGPLRVLLRVDDPWVVSRWPMWPATDACAYTCATGGVPVSAEDPEEEGLSRFVAGAGELPKLANHLGWLWRLVVLAPELVRAGARADLAAACKAGLRRHKRAALLAVADEELSKNDVVHALIATGLAAAALEEATPTTSRTWVLERLWSGWPAVAALATGDLSEDDAIAETAMVQCGDILAEILAGHDDPHALVGRFGPESEQLARLPPEQLDMIWQAAAVVPKALLDADTRVTAARQMFDARHKPLTRAITNDAKKLASAAERIVKASWHLHLADAIAARRPPDGKSGWYALPAMSIAMALIARLAARGNGNCETFERSYRGKWASLALEAPDLVAIDLVLAEALVSAAFTDQQDTPENPND